MTQQFIDYALPLIQGETKMQKEENEWVSLDTLFTHMYNFTNTAVNGRLLRKVLACTGKAINDMQDAQVEAMEEEPLDSMISETTRIA